MARSRDCLRSIALATELAGAVCGFALMLYAGRRQPSWVLLAAFTGWTVSPFLAGAWAVMVSKQWSSVSRWVLYVISLAVTLSSVAIYAGVAFGYLRAKVGFVFLVVPFASWLLISIASIPGFARRRPSEEGA